MTLEPLRLLERIHGHIGWLAAAALVHPAILLRRDRRRADLAVIFATSLVTVTAAMGFSLYGAYREEVKQPIFQHAPALGFLFERKEHLAAAAVLFAWAGALAYVGAWRAKDPLRTTLRLLAFRAYVAGCVLAIVVAAFGTVVAAYRSF